MLVTMLSVWSVEGHPHYPSMGEGQRIAFISGEQAHYAHYTVLSASFTHVLTLYRYRRSGSQASLHCDEHCNRGIF
jgi:hypothetical protein